MRLTATCQVSQLHVRFERKINGILLYHWVDITIVNFYTEHYICIMNFHKNDLV